MKLTPDELAKAQLEYLEKRKDPERARALASFPSFGAGHRYAGDPVRGLKYSLVYIPLVLGVGSGLAAGSDKGPNLGLGILIILSLPVALISNHFEKVDAGKAAEEYNHELKKQLGLYVERNQETSTYYKNSLAVYESKRRSPWVGFGLAYFFPSAGHFYANDWGRGLKIYLGEAIGAALIGTGNNNVDIAGVIIFLTARIWELVDAYDAVEDYNTKLKQGLNLAYGFDPYYNMTVGLNYRF